MADLPVDFPELYCDELFNKSKFWIAKRIQKEEKEEEMEKKEKKEEKEIVGVVALLAREEVKDNEDERRKEREGKQSHDVEWLGVFSVSETIRGGGLGKKLLQIALDNTDLTTKRVRLVTLEGRMKIAIGLYEKFGFVVDEKIQSNSYVVLFMEKEIERK